MKKLKKHWQLLLLLIPAFIYILIFCYGPMYGIIIAFEDYKPKKGFLGSEFVGLEHFIRFLTFPDFWKLLKNTLALSVYSLLTFPCAILLALLFNEIKSVKFKKAVQMITYAPHFLSMVVLCSLVTLLVGREGPLGVLYASISGHEENLLALPQYFRHIYVWSGVWQSIGWGSIIYLAALSGISPELVEAARIDGAKRWQIIRYVNLPGIMPTVVTMFILSLGSILNVGFEKILLLQNDLNLSVSNVIDTYVYQVGLIGGQFSYSTAIGLFNNVINITVLLISNRILKKVSGIGLW